MLKIGIVLIPLIIILVSSDIILLNENLQRKVFEKYSIYDSINASPEKINAQAESLNKYLEQEEELSPILLNEKERMHMRDVQKIVTRGHQALVISFLSLVCCLFLSQEKKRIILRGSLLTLILLGVIITLDFPWFFYKLHLLLFRNNFWLLNPATDNLIKMYPEQVFQALIQKTLLLASLLSLGGIAIGLYKTKKEEEKWQK